MRDGLGHPMRGGGGVAGLRCVARGVVQGSEPRRICPVSLDRVVLTPKP